jgi:hypothetical protein
VSKTALPGGIAERRLISGIPSGELNLPGGKNFPFTAMNSAHYKQASAMEWKGIGTLIFTACVLWHGDCTTYHDFGYRNGAHREIA